MGLEPQELNRALQGRGRIAPVWIRILDHFNLELTVKVKAHNDKSDPGRGGGGARSEAG